MRFFKKKLLPEEQRKQNLSMLETIRPLFISAAYDQPASILRNNQFLENMRDKLLEHTFFELKSYQNIIEQLWINCYGKNTPWETSSRITIRDLDNFIRRIQDDSAS